MEFRNIIISNPAKISIKNEQLCIAQGEEFRIPLEDICTIMVESRQVALTSAALEQLAANGATIFFCDKKHLPSAQLFSMNQFSRQRKLLYAQFELPKPKQKQLWQSIVRQKIKNQALCLRLAEKEGWERLFEMSASVRSGDPDNLEAQAAAYYFPRLFGKDFTRDDLCMENAALNYGYAIIRGSVARNLVVHGLEPCVGINHCNQLNQYNLADDLMEPYRPLVDLSVAVTDLSDEDGLTPSLKRMLFNITNKLVAQGGQKLRVMLSVNRSAASLATSIVEKSNKLELPELIGLEEGRYE